MPFEMTAMNSDPVDRRVFQSTVWQSLEICIEELAKRDVGLELDGFVKFAVGQQELGHVAGRRELQPTAFDQADVFV
jgi:hypothetical protein